MIKGELKIHDDAFKKLLMGKSIRQDMSMPSLKVTVFFICLCFKMVSFRGLTQNCQRASPPLLYWSPPPPPPGNKWVKLQLSGPPVGHEQLSYLFIKA